MIMIIIIIIITIIDIWFSALSTYNVQKRFNINSPKVFDCKVTTDNASH